MNAYVLDLAPAALDVAADSCAGSPPTPSMVSADSGSGDSTAVSRSLATCDEERLLELSSRMSNARSSQFLNGELGFLTAAGAEQLLEVEEVEQSPPGESGASGGEPEPESDDDAFGDDDDDSDDDGTGVTDDEFLAAIAKPTAPSVPTASDDAHDALAALFCDSDDEASPMSV